MPLTKAQTAQIDVLIGNNKKAIDIIEDMVANHGAKAREVDAYVKENKTLQGMLKTVTHRAKDIASAGTEAERKQLTKEISDISKKAIKILQQKADE